MKLLGVLLLTFSISTFTVGQSNKHEQDVVELSGIVVTDEGGEAVVLPYTNVGVKGTSRGTTTAMDGFFSLVVIKGETIVFSRIGYKNEKFTVPDSLTSAFHSIEQSLTKDTILLAEAIIYPWPSNENFKEEFLSMDVDDEFQLRADENLKSISMSGLRDSMRLDGRESTSAIIQNNVNKAHSTGLIQVLNILDLRAWKNFFNKLTSGGFKKKDKEKNAFDNFVKDEETHGILIENNGSTKNKTEDH